jgi:hypothetical protein
LTQYLGHIDCLQVKSKDDFVLFNDLMKSITILRYNTDEGKFDEVKNIIKIDLIDCEFWHLDCA